MSRLDRRLVVVGAAGVVATVASMVLALASGHVEDREVVAVIQGLVVASYVGVGLFAWSRRPENRVGPLMIAVGFATALPALSYANASVPFTLGVLFSSLYIVGAAQLVLAFPSGRLADRAERILVGVGYTLTLVVPVLSLLFSPDCGCGDGTGYPDSAIFVDDRPGLIDVVNRTSGVVGALLTLPMVLVLLRRWRRASRHGRRALAPVLWTGLALVVLLTATLGLDAAGGAGGVGEVVDLLALTAFAALPYAFLVGLARTRSWRAGATSALLDALGATRATRLRDAFAEALGDPTVELAYWLPETRRHVDAQGRSLALPEQDDPGRVSTSVERDGRRVGAIVHDRALCDDPELVRAVAAGASLALDHARLDAELRARVEELERSRARLLEVGLAERRRIERDLHDGAQQRLVALSLQLGMAAARLDDDPECARTLLDGARTEAREALEELRELARGIHPSLLTDRGLGPALETLAARASLPVEVHAQPEGRLPGPVEAAAYFVVAESLANVAKYAQATHAEVRVGHEHGWALIEVRDDGVGGADPARGSGLRGLADRLEVLDGHLEVESTPGRGTAVRARVPCGTT